MKAKGFTLIELIVVIVILGILFSMMVPGYQAYLSTQNPAEAFFINN